MKEDLEFLKRLLPKHYKCEPREKGVHCDSYIGIDENDLHWVYIVEAIKQHFKDRFMEIFHQTCTDHLKFTVYFRVE